jgi:hypothetical protein
MRRRVDRLVTRIAQQPPASLPESLPAVLTDRAQRAGSSAELPLDRARNPEIVARKRCPDEVNSATAAVNTAPTATVPDTAADESLDAIVSLGLHTVLRLPGVTATVRRWRYRGNPRVEFVIVGVPTDQAGSELRDRLLRMRAQVLCALVARGLHVFSTERNHDEKQPRMTMIDRLK